MAQDSAQLDRLIEEGLTLYGQGDLDGALLIWEQVLAKDPDNAQAISYVDYVRLNYDLLTAENEGTQESSPFGIADDGEPDYQIEIMPGDIVAPQPTRTMPGPPMYVDPVDEGWSMDEELNSPYPPLRPPAPVAVYIEPHYELPDAVEPEGEPEPLPLTLELEAEEPVEEGGVNFEDATREFDQRDRVRPPDPAAPDAPASEFNSEGTPGFGSPQDFSRLGSQTTDVRKRDLGFIKISTPPPGEDPTAKSPPAPPASLPAFTLSYSASGELDLPPTGDHPPLEPMEPDELARQVGMKSTRDLPGAMIAPRPPSSSAASAIEQFELDDSPVEPPPPLGSAPTRELTEQDVQVLFHKAKTQDLGDLSDRPTQQISPRTAADAAAYDPLISAPTRELGMRPPGRSGDDETTADSARAHRERPASQRDGTRADIMLPFDPIDARTAQILDDIDEGAPRDEPKEDQTRRRITRLFERALQWANEHELDRAVAAVDLALSEDPNSALAQKLIHRNRETMMSVFQGFLGDLSRQPVLARPLHELANAPISPRAAFLLSRVDGMISIDEILDVSGMPRLEAYRYLCQLYLRGILR